MSAPTAGRAQSAREEARRPDGRFGEQVHERATGTVLSTSSAERGGTADATDRAAAELSEIGAGVAGAELAVLSWGERSDSAASSLEFSGFADADGYEVSEWTNADLAKQEAPGDAGRAREEVTRLRLAQGAASAAVERLGPVSFDGGDAGRGRGKFLAPDDAGVELGEEFTTLGSDVAYVVRIERD